MAGVTQVQTTLNGEVINFLCEPRQSLLEVLRDVLGMTGTKEGCNDGNCGESIRQSATCAARSASAPI